MKITPVLYGLEGGNPVSEFALRWGTCLNRRDAAGFETPVRSINFALDGKSLWRIAGRPSGLRIQCRKGRLWITQSGVAADVILHAGQDFVAVSDGAIVVQSVPAPAAERDDSTAADLAREPVAFGVVTLPAGRARSAVVSKRELVPPQGAGWDWARPDAAMRWEQLACGLAWLSALVAIAYCFKTVVGLPWPH
jgi:hypothetical protein